MIEVKNNLPDFKRDLEAFSFDMEKRIVRGATVAGTLVFKKEVLRILERPRRSPPKTGKHAVPPGTLRRSIYIKRDFDSRNGQEHYFVGARSGKSARTNTSQGGATDAFYWRFVELGHLIRRPGQAIRGGKRSAALQRARANAAGAARVRAYPFFKPAFDQGKEPALQRFTDRIAARIEKENKKTTSKTAAFIQRVFFI